MEDCAGVVGVAGRSPPSVGPYCSWIGPAANNRQEACPDPSVAHSVCEARESTAFGRPVAIRDT